MSARGIAAALGLIFSLQCGLVARPSLADDEHHWRGHERWEHHDRGRHQGWGRYRGRRQYYYAPRPEVYYYEPPPVYIPPPPPPPSIGFDLIFPFRFH